MKTDTRSSLTIKAAVPQGVIQEAGVGVKGRSEDKHAGVEAVGPAGIRSCRQLVSLKQLVHVAQDLRGHVQDGSDGFI